MAWKDRLTSKGGQQVLSGANFAIYTLIVLALIVLVNWFVSNHDKTADMTPNKKYSLSEQTRKILRDLNKDVTIYAFDRQRGFSELRDVLGMYSTASDKVKVKYVDPDHQPALAREFGVRSYGTIVVAAGDRHMEAQGSNEQGITNALIGVLKGQRTACFVEVHGARSLDSTESDGYDRFKKQLSDENYQTQVLPFMQKPEVPGDCTMVVVPGPHDDYLPPEIDALDKYLRGGGRALVMLDAGFDLPNLTKLLGDWGVTARNDLVIDDNPVAQLFGTEPYMPLIVKYGTSAIVQPLKDRATLFPLTRSMEVDKNSKPGISDDSLCDTTAESYDVKDWNPKITEIKFEPNKDMKGPFTVAVSGTVSGSGEKKEGRFVALGSSLVPANNYLNFQGNRDFIMNSIAWLSADEDLISVRPKPPESQHLNMNAQQMTRLLALGVFGAPILIIAAGVIVWAQRR